MTPLVGGNAELAPSSISYDAIDAQRHPLMRIPSEESLNTVFPLPGMVIRCHSINVSSVGRQHAEGICAIRTSSTKVALRAVQLERRAARKRQQQTNTSSQTTIQQPLAHDHAAHSPSSFTIKDGYWIDIETPQRSTDELYEFLKQLRLPPFFVSILSEPFNWTSEVVALKQVALAIFQILPTNPNENVEITHVALLSMPRLLVTFHTFSSQNEDGANAVDKGLLYRLVSQYVKQRGRVPEPSNSGMLLAWLQFHVRRTARALRELRLAAVEMDRAMDRDHIGNFDFEQLVETKNCLLRVRSVAEEQHGTIEAIAVAEEGTEGLDFGNCRGALSMLRANASSNERLSSRVDKHLNELRERVMSHREDTLNQRLALLTILSAIFMPLTLLSGIWGMNFENMPELEYEHSYQIALFGMFALALCLVYSFHIAGWSS
mmetsp:Transcript_22628/g.40816  ORF Transcript_22628/g.40816 Transcript_22628/m.40816 type:complete len:434 (-) Transcript_22628:185-1486(-)